jgi:hypothetical protein
MKAVRRFFVAVLLLFVLCLAVVGQTEQNDIRPSIQRIVSKLSKETTLHLGAPVGFSGIPETNNKYYKLYQKLSSKATDKELVSLTNENSKTVVLYSFLILYSRNYSDLKQVFLKNIKDTADVWIAGGCTGSVTRVNTFMLKQLNPAYMDSRQPYLTQEEYDKYIKEFGATN